MNKHESKARMLYLFGHGQPCDLCNSVKALIHYILDIYSSLHPYHRLAWSICPSLAASPHSCLPEPSGHWMTSFAAKVNKVNMWKVNLRTHCTDFYDLLFYSLLSSTDLAFLTSHFLKSGYIYLSLHFQYLRLRTGSSLSDSLILLPVGCHGDPDWVSMCHLVQVQIQWLKCQTGFVPECYSKERKKGTEKRKARYTQPF